MNIVKKYTRSLLLGICLLFVPALCLAGAWTSEKGSMYNKLGLNYYHADHVFNGGGDEKSMANNGVFKDVNLNYYLEYGLCDQTTLIASITQKYLKFEDDSIIRKSWGLSDMELALKHRLMNGKYGVLSIQGLIKVPELYDEDKSLPLGNGQYDFEPRLLYGCSLWQLFPGYCNFEIGYRFRLEEPADEFRYLAELGMDFTQTLYGRVKLDGIKGMKNSDMPKTAGGNPALSLDFDLGKLDLALGWKMTPRWSMEFAYAPEIYGENISSGNKVSLAVVYLLP